MKKVLRLLKFGLLPILTVGFLFAYQNANKPLNEREKYEQFLQEQYKTVPDFSKEELQNIDKPGQPDLAAIQDYFTTLDPALGRVPTERLAKAQQQATVNSLKSTTNITWEGTDANMGGRTRAIMFDPNDANQSKVWAGGVTGGLWYNDDIISASSAWHAVDDFWASLSISCIKNDPNNTNVFYVGTGEVQTSYITYRESSGVGVGIYKSENGGVDWTLLSSTAEFKYISDIVIRDENGTSVIYAGVASGYYHGNQQSQPTDGLYRSIDGGTSWDQVLPNIDGFDVPYCVSDIALGADGKMYVGSMRNINGDGGATIFTSTEGTLGSWDVFDDIRVEIENGSLYYLPGRVILAPAPSDENIVYALIGAGNNQDSYVTRYYCPYILKTDDKGENWTELNLPEGNAGWASLSWHALVASVNPTNPNLVYVGGLDVWNTLNGGSHYNHLSDWALMYYGGGDEYVHADQHAQLYRPGTSDEMILSSDGGIFYTSYAGTSSPVFEERNKGFNTLQFYTAAISPNPGEEKYVGGLQDNGTLLYTGDPLDINDMVSGGDGAYAFFDQDQPEIMITSVYYNRFRTFINDEIYTYIEDYQSGIFINPCDYDSRDNTLYCNAVSFTSGHANQILRISDVDGWPNGQFVGLDTGIDTWFSHVKLSQYSPIGEATLYLGSNSGRLFRVNHAETNNPGVEEITGDDFPMGSISCVDIAGSEDTLVVTFSNYGVASVWQTFDGGQSWTDKEGNLPDMPIRWVIYHPLNSQQAMLATELGVYTTNELHETETMWSLSNEGLANVRVDMFDLRKADNTVLAATHGRGLFAANFPLDPNTGIGSNVANNPSIKLYPNPTFGMLTIDMPNAVAAYQIKVFAIDGKLVAQAKVEKTENHQMDLSSLKKGNYVLTLDDGFKKYSEKLVIK
jgi:photosystem II stability/assembly factor-like uncharacterized protein